MKTTTLLIALFFFLFQPLDCISQSALGWVKQMGGPLYQSGDCIAIDASGSIITVGYLYGTADFDPGPGVYNLTSKGNADIFISKFDASGNFIWAEAIGSIKDDWAGAIEVDAEGNIYVVGFFQGIIDVNPGPAIYNISPHNNTNCFLLKLDTFGKFKWERNLWSINGSYAYINHFQVDQFDNLYLIGNFTGAVDFDPGVGLNVVSPSYLVGNYFLKLDSAGNFDWVKTISSTQIMYANSIAVDEYENLYIAGDFDEVVDFDPGAANFFLNPSSSTDIYFLKLDSLGNFVWARQFGGTAYSSPTSIILKNGTINMTGYFSGTVYFDNTFLYAGSNEDVFIASLNTYNGGINWARSYKGCSMTKFPTCNAMSVDVLGNIYLGGGFSGTVNFDPGNPIFNFTSIGNSDAFFLKLSASGQLIWATNIGGAAQDFIKAIEISPSGTLFITGQFSDIVDFDPTPTVSKMVSYGSSDCFVLKLSQAILPLRLITFVGQLQDNTAHLQWAADNEQNFSHYELQRSTNGKDFTKVTDQKAKGGSSKNNYSYDDDVSNISSQPHYENRLYYRLEMIDNDGTFKYSNIVLITPNNKSQTIAIFPNPAKDIVYIQLPIANSIFATQQSGYIIISLTDAIGKEVLLRKLSTTNGLITLSTANLPSGIYTVKLIADNEVHRQQLVVGK